MSRQSRRISRPLIAILLLAVSIIALSYIYKANRVGASAKEGGQPIPLAMNLTATAGNVPAAPAALPPTNSTPDSVIPPAPVFLDKQSTATDAASETTPPATTRPSSDSAGLKPSDSLPGAVPAAERMSATDSAQTGPASLVDQAESEIKSGRILKARGELNDALESNTLDDSQKGTVKAALGQISDVVVFGRDHFADDTYGGIYAVQPGDSLAKIAFAHDVTWELLSRINGIDPRHLRAGSTIKVIQGPVFAVVTKSTFTMDIYLGGFPGEKSAMYVTTYPVGLGRDDSTPVGTWMIETHRKIKHPTYYSPRGEGVIPADDPKNPLGGYWIGLTGTEGQAVGKMSYGIHGTIEPNSIGKQSSMGCIRLGAKDIPVVYDLMVEGKSMVLVKP